MRREILFSVLGFLGGFVAAAMVFWQPVVQTNNPPQQAASEASLSREDASSAPGDHSRRRLVVTTRENADGATVADSAPKPQGPAEILHDVLGKLKDMDMFRGPVAIDELVKKLRAAGPEGLQVLRDYFRVGQDVELGYSHQDVNSVFIQTLREALLNRLGAWPASEALDLARETLRTTSSFSEALVAASVIERNSPGIYRNEASQTLLKLASMPVDEHMGTKDNPQLIDAMRQFKITEFLPAAEAAVTEFPQMYVSSFIASLEALPEEARTPALQRLFANEKITKVMMEGQWAMRLLDYSETVVVQNVAQLFAANTDKRLREKFLTDFANTQRVTFHGSGSSSSAGSDDKSPDRIARIQSRIAFLDTIAPQCDTPVLQERLQDTREALQKAVAETLQRNATTDKK